MKHSLKLFLLSLACLSAIAQADKVDDLIGRAMKDLHIPGIALEVIKDGKIEDLEVGQGRSYG